MGFNSAFKGLIVVIFMRGDCSVLLCVVCFISGLIIRRVVTVN